MSKINIKINIKNNGSTNLGNLPKYTYNSRYNPKNIYDIHLDQSVTSQLHDWFTKLNTTCNSSLFIKGPPGCGKTTIARLFSIHYGYTIKEYTASDCARKHIVKNHINNMQSNIPIDSLMFGKYKYIIIIDEIECMVDKNNKKNLIKMVTQNDKNTNKYHIPMIFVSCDTSDKKIIELSKHSTLISLTRPNSYKLEQILIKFIDQFLNVPHKLKICLTKNQIKMIINNVNGDYRRLINMVDIIINEIEINGCNSISDQVIDQCCNMFHEKYLDQNIYQNTLSIFTDHNIINSIRVYENDKTLLPMMVHENYTELISKSYDNKLDQLNVNMKVINCIVMADQMDKIMYNTQSWHYSTIHGLMSCYVPSYYSSTDTIRPNIRFTTTLGKHSQLSSNKKKILDILSNIGNGKYYTNSDLQCLGNIIKYYSLHETNKNIDIIKQFMKNYSLSFDIIDKIIKFNKSGSTDNLLYNAKLKSFLKQQLGNIKIKTLVEHCANNDDNSSDSDSESD